MTTLEQAIRQNGNPVEVLRDNSTRSFSFPLVAEYTNWRSEQRSWLESVAFMDQSHHMSDLFVSGPDAIRFFQWIGANSAASYQVDRAKQLVAVNSDGYLIGDGILFQLAEDSFDLVALPMLSDWVAYNLETGDWDVVFERDDRRGGARRGHPKLYRYEVQGPRALAVIEKATGAPAPDLRFFHMGRIEIAGASVRVLRHGMAGQPGFELWGPWADGERVKEELLAAGAEHGIAEVGLKAYWTASLGSGWIPSPLPAIFGPELSGYRDWLDLDKVGSLGGSFHADDITQYYVTPFDVGLGRSVSFDHDFHGAAALRRHADTQRRTKVTLLWHPADVERALGSVLDRDELPAKYLDLPKPRYAQFLADQVLVGDEMVGLSLDVGFLSNVRAFLSLATIDIAYAAPGTEVTVLWGEDPNSRKRQVEEHRVMAIRATVVPTPYYDFAREGYRASNAVAHTPVPATV